MTDRTGTPKPRALAERPAITGIRSWLSRPAVRYACLILVANMALFLIAEHLYERKLRIGDLWTVRLAVLTALLLLDNLLVVWVYTTAALSQAKAARQQVDVGRQQFELAREGFQAAEARIRRSELPCVVIDWQVVRIPGKPEGWVYTAHNIGPGLAINAVYVRDVEAEKLEPIHLGALGPGESVELPQTVKQILWSEEISVDRRRHVVLAQALAGDEWVGSGNLMHSDKRLSHRVKVVKLTAEQLKQLDKVTLDEYVHEHWTEVRAELDQMLKALEASK